MFKSSITIFQVTQFAKLWNKLILVIFKCIYSSQMTFMRREESSDSETEEVPTDTAVISTNDVGSAINSKFLSTSKNKTQVAPHTSSRKPSMFACILYLLITHFTSLLWKRKLSCKAVYLIKWYHLLYLTYQFGQFFLLTITSWSLL